MWISLANDYLLFPSQLLWILTPPFLGNTGLVSASAWMKSPGSCPLVKGLTPRSGRGSWATWPTAWHRSTPWTTPVSTSSLPGLPTPPSASPWFRCPTPLRRPTSCLWTGCRAKAAPRLVYHRTPRNCTEASRSYLPQTDSLLSLFPTQRLRPTAPLFPCTPTTSAHRFQRPCPPVPPQATRTQCGDPGEGEKHIKDFIKTLIVLFVQCYKSLFVFFFLYLQCVIKWKDYALYLYSQ